MSLVADAVSANPLLWQTPIDFNAIVCPSQTAQTAQVAVLPSATAVMRPEEPSSFSLMLVGFGALVVVRSLTKRVQVKAKLAATVKTPTRTQRRAA